MTCNDCIYEPKCYSRIANGMGDDEIRGGLLTDIDKRCKGFKNKADFVPVVRCCNCIHLIATINKETCCDFHSTIWDKFYVRPDDYCSYGERKE